jgi:diadenosine tetraphosphate (Ap4A) HIT family hydrolase
MESAALSPFLEVPEAEWVCANDLCFAIFDSFPVSPGHVLVITRRVVPPG